MTKERKRYPKPRCATTPKLTIREYSQEKKGRLYSSFRVEGLRDPVTGQRKQRQFKTREEAEAFVATHQVAALNAVPLHTVTTRLSPDQVVEAEAAFRRLGDRGTLEAAVSLYLGRAAAPEKAIVLHDALLAFLIGKEKAGLRSSSIRQLESTISLFIRFAEGQGIGHVHEVDTETVELFLQSIRAKNKVDRATPKTRRNYRLDLSSFFNWCSQKDRRWILANPCEGIEDDELVDEGNEPEILTIWRSARMMRDAETFADGALLRYLALALFAGLRPGRGREEGELRALASHPDQSKLIDIKKGVIEIPGPVSKTRKKRIVNIRPNLRAWLEATDGKPIIPVNHDRLLRTFRKRHTLSRDVLRHSFISYHVGAFRSVGDAALEAGNSESVIKKHYLNPPTRDQGLAFWRISPKASKVSKRGVGIAVEFAKHA